MSHLICYRKSLAGKKNSAPEENPVRVVAAFAPSRARNMTGLHPTTVYRYFLKFQLFQDTSIKYIE